MTACLFSSYISTFLETIGLKLTGMSFQYIFCMDVIKIGNTYAALFKQKSLAVHVFIKILVLIRTYMIRFNISKDTDVIDKSLASMKHKSLR